MLIKNKNYPNWGEKNKIENKFMTLNYVNENQFDCNDYLN